jgi:hypothetical protein
LLTPLHADCLSFRPSSFARREIHQRHAVKPLRLFVACRIVPE